MYFFKYFIFILFISQTYQFSLINNEQISSDAISEIFFDGILRSQDLDGVISRDSSNYDTQCLAALKEMKNQFPSLKVAPFFDAWGKIPSGLLYGNFYDIGNFDQCVKTSVAISKEIGTVDGQFCFARLLIKDKLEQFMRLYLESPSTEPRFKHIEEPKISIGICVPDICRQEYLTALFKNLTSGYLNGALSEIEVSSCTNGKTPPLEAINIIGIAIFSIVAILLVLSTMYDMFITYLKYSPKPLLLTFSLVTNGRKLFAINTTRCPNTISCLTGIRVLSMTWIIYCHTYMTSPHFPAINNIISLEWSKAFYSMHILNGTVSVDSFFFISGLLVAWLGFREMDRRNGKLNIPMMYLHRYIRLTPVVAAVLLFTLSINNLLYTGPFKEIVLKKNECTSHNWWPILLYISNYYRVSSCFDQTWYLCVDFQLYVLSPLLLIPMWKWGRKFAPVLLILALMSVGCVISIYMTHGFTHLITGARPEDWSLTYIPTHTRCSPWLVGFALGYFMNKNRQKGIRISKVLNVIGWIVSLFILFIIVFGPYFTIKTHEEGTIFEAAMYEGWKRFSWAIALSWITCACHFGYGGYFDSFLSNPFWQPFGRLTFSLYLVHMTIVRINFGSLRTEQFFSDYNEILLFWSSFGISLMVSIMVSLAFESPVLALEKIIFKTKKKEKKANGEMTISHLMEIGQPSKNL